jgi:hypothetical protein
VLLNISQLLQNNLLCSLLMVYLFICTGSLAYFANIGHFTDHFAWQQSAQHLLLFLFAISQGPFILFQCIGDGIRCFSSETLHHTTNTSFIACQSSAGETEDKKHPEYFFVYIIFSAGIITVHFIP